MSVLNHVIKLRTPVTIKHNPDVTVPLDVQLLILKKAKKRAIDNTQTLGICDVISYVAREVLMNKLLSARQVISVFNFENARRFGKAKPGSAYWWDITCKIGSNNRRNMKPRLMFLDWCIRQTKKDMEKKENY